MQIPLNYNVCPHCGKPVGAPQGEAIGALRYVLYIISFFIPPLGIIIGIVFMISSEPDKKRVGKNCLLIAIIAIVLEIVLLCVILPMLFAFSLGL